MTSGVRVVTLYMFSMRQADKREFFYSRKARNYELWRQVPVLNGFCG